MSTMLKLPVLGEAISTFQRWAAELRRIKFVTEDNLASLLKTSGGVLLPVGTPIPTFAASAPAGFLLLDGSTYPVSDYNDLFNVYLYTFGGSGQTFKVPDMRGRFLFGKAASGTGSTLAGTFGNLDHTHSVPAHYHAMGTGADLNITSSGSHVHTQTYATGGGAVSEISNAGFTALGNGSGTLSNIASASHTHPAGNIAGKIGLVTGGVDGNAAMTTGSGNPPSIVCNWITRY